MPKLKKDPTLADYQEYVRQLVEERGFEKTSVQDLFLLLLES